MKKGDNYSTGSKRKVFLLTYNGTQKSSENWADEPRKLFRCRYSFNDNSSFTILRQLCDKEGRYIVVGLEVVEVTLMICNIYVP